MLQYIEQEFDWFLKDFIRNSIDFQKVSYWFGGALIDLHNIGEIRLANTTKLLPNQVTAVELTIITESEKFVKALFNSLEFLMGKEIDLQIIGEIKAKVFGIGKKVKFNEHHKLSLKDLNN